MNLSSPTAARPALDQPPDPHAPPPSRRPSGPLVERIAAWSIRHRRVVLLGWIALVVLAVAVGGFASGTTAPARSPGEAGRAEQALADAGREAPAREQVLVRRAAGTGDAVRDAQVRQALGELATALRALPGSATSVRTALEDPGLLSPDGHAALATFEVVGDDPDEAVVPAQAAVAKVARAHPDLVVVQAGDASVDKAIGDQVGADLSRAERTSLPLTLAILVLVFGSLVAAGLPVLLAAGCVAAAVSLLSVPGRWLPLDDSTTSVVVLVGMAVGVDYCLFYLRREREERALGRSGPDALRVATATSGRAVVTAGLTVAGSLAGLLLTGIDIFAVMALGTMTVVGLSVLAAVTALPAALSLLGDRVEALRVPWWGSRRRTASRSRFWGAVVRRVVRRPRIAALLAATLLGALAAVGVGLPTGAPPLSLLAEGTPVAPGVSELARAFPGQAASATVVVHGEGATGAAGTAALDRLRTAVSGRPSTFPAAPSARPGTGGGLLVVDVPLAGSGSDATSVAALDTLRTAVLPAALAGTSLRADVGGQTASDVDFDRTLQRSQWWVVGFVGLLALVLLVRAFGSPLLALAAIGLTGASVAASYGVLSLVFEHGLLQAWGVPSYGAVVSWLPLFMFVLLFGLTMDYQVFLISRIREARDGRPVREAVVTGIGRSAGVVTSAAVIMVSVFSIFALLDFAPMAMFGIGMAVAVALDATLIRGVLLPAVLVLLGERAWQVPAWLPRALRPRPEGVEVSPAP
ncbi:MAG: MMPL family transporter [Kineosporiaceae bacterium]